MLIQHLITQSPAHTTHGKGGCGNPKPILTAITPGEQEGKKDFFFHLVPQFSEFFEFWVVITLVVKYYYFFFFKKKLTIDFKRHQK